MGTKLRLQVLIGEQQLVIPSHDGASIKWLMEEAQKRANVLGATHVINESGFQFGLDDKVRSSLVNLIYSFRLVLNCVLGVFWAVRGSGSSLAYAHSAPLPIRVYHFVYLSS